MRADLYQHPDITKPLNPFPSTWVGNVPGGISETTILTVLFFVVFVIWSIFTLVAIYHWFRYAHQSWLAVPIVAMHLVVSVFLLLFIVSGLR